MSALIAGAAVAAALAGCGASLTPVNSAQGGLALRPGASLIDTNCTGCNTRTERGQAVEQFTAHDSLGNAARVVWSVSGGDRAAGPGTIDADGRYTPPTYLTSDQVQVVVTAETVPEGSIAADGTIVGGRTLVGRTAVTVTPGFLSPLDPQNAAVGPGGSVTLTGRLAQAGGAAEISFAIASGGGVMSTPVCDHGQETFTTCTVTYTAPAGAMAETVASIVATAGGARTRAAVLVNEAGVASNPAAHQGMQQAEMPLGASGGNNADFDTRGTAVADCCSGTLGGLVADEAGRQYLLSNNHVLARSDRAARGDAIVQPGLIDNNCTPYGDGAGTTPVAWLTAWLPLNAARTNADAAIAMVGSRTVDSGGKILELGTRQANGELGSAAPGTSSSGGKGEAASLGMLVAKSGRTTGLTCAAVSAVDLDVSVDYFKDCAETQPYLTKTFTHQVAISGTRFSDAGDSGALAVDAANAEPVGLLFAGGVDAAGVSHAVANPAGEVLRELSAQAGGSYRFVGGADHAVSCLQYGNAATAAAQAMALSNAQIAAGRRALVAARDWAEQHEGVLGVALGKSSDAPGSAAVVVYVDAGSAATVPETFENVRTVVIATTAQAVALGTAPLANEEPAQVSKAALGHALQVKDQVAGRLMRQAWIFGVGVGASLDDARAAALVIYVDRNRMPAALPSTVDGLRARYVVMDRLHVTRSYLGGVCRRTAAGGSDDIVLRHRLF